MLIETDRLAIRPFQANDWENALEYLTDPAVMHYIPLGVMDKNQVMEFVSEEPNEKTECFAIELKSEKKVIGQVIYHPWFAKDTFEIGWIIHPGYQKKGYATEASKAVIRYGFMEQKLHRIIATCQPDNPSSWKVAEKIGMYREGFFRQSIFTEQGIWWDEYFYAILVNDWSQND